MSAPIPIAAAGEAAKSGPLGLVLILALCVACYFLFKSMSKHLRKVREGFPTDPSAAPGAADLPGVASQPMPQAEPAAEQRQDAPPA